MTIGNVVQKSFESNGKVVKYIEMIIRPPFMNSATFTISENKNKDKESAPDYFINYSYNRKNETFRRVRVGSLWNKVSDNGVQYKSGYIETPAVSTGKLYITLFKAKQFENEAQAPNWLYDVIYQAPQTKKEIPVNTYQNGEYQSTTNYEPTPTDIDTTEDCPF
jgi:uncharacterized protein (DUF736 family)